LRSVADCKLDREAQQAGHDRRLCNGHEVPRLAEFHGGVLSSTEALEMPYDKVPRRRPPVHAPGPESDLRLALPSRVRALARIAVMATTVLVIDDDPAFRALAVRMLVGMGLAVVGEAGTVEGARKAADSLRPESALVDVGLPDGDGVTLAGMLASLPWRPRIVLTSSDPEATTPADARSVGAASFIAKDDLPESGLRALLTGPGEPEYG